MNIKRYYETKTIPQWDKYILFGLVVMQNFIEESIKLCGYTTPSQYKYIEMRSL